MLLLADVIGVVVLGGLLWLATRLRPAKTRRMRSVGTLQRYAPEPTFPLEPHVAPPPNAPTVNAERVTTGSNGSANGFTNGASVDVTAPVKVRRAVVVAPRGKQWVVQRDGARRVSSVHDTKEAAEAKARATAFRERVPLEIRDTEETGAPHAVEA